MTEGNAVPAEKRRILLADDDEALARALGRALNAAGFDIELVHDGDAAIEAVGKSSFDVILTDIRMPGTTGIDLLRVVRSHDLDVPVVLMTGNPEMGNAIAALELGALQYLTKPFSLELMVSVMERASKLHRMAELKRDAFALQGRARRRSGRSCQLGSCARPRDRIHVDGVPADCESRSAAFHGF